MPVPVMLVDHASALGGAEHSLLLLLRHLDRKRWTPFLLCPEGALAQAARALAVPVQVVSFPRLRGSPLAAYRVWAQALTLARYARAWGARLLVANTVRSAFYTALAARLARRPFIWHMRDFWLSERRPRFLAGDRWGKRFLCAMAARVITNSYATAAHVPCPARVTVVHNGIDVTAFQAADAEGRRFRRTYGIPPEAILVGTVGRLRPWKGQDRFLRVMARVMARAPQAYAVVVGGTPFRVSDAYPARLRSLAAAFGIASRTVFTGHLEDVRPAFAAMDVFVHAGDPEPFGLAVVEAMAAGKPVVAFAHGALPEIVVHGETGLLVPPYDEDAMAAAILTLATSPEHRRRLGEAARTRAARAFTAARMAKAVMAVWSEVVQGA